MAKMTKTEELARIAHERRITARRMGMDPDGAAFKAWLRERDRVFFAKFGKPCAWNDEACLPERLVG